ncbi:MAG: outer membrane beta-barrel protein [Bacteroidales bacterium]|nr:outer membrane beta-barrel protein [Bacteroidales bacterium]HPD94305.1 DUF6089 family protein [Tenuifilaceae bacterium]HRX30353.1 DUF6089 family protein [Tenuifilaceae bacterium]
MEFLANLIKPTLPYITSAILLISFLPEAKAQDKRDFGIQAGSSYYYGDFNETMPFYQPSFGFGVIFRYNFNPNYSIRTSAIYTAVKGSFPSDYFLPTLQGASFSKTIISTEVMGEFNFIPFNPINNRSKKFSPYVNLGIGLAQVGGNYIPHIPFSLGIKYTPGMRHTFALEWRFHKTFTDKIDDYAAPNDGKIPYLHNNDWFSFFGLIYTYRLFNQGNLCPAYKD